MESLDIQDQPNEKLLLYLGGILFFTLFLSVIILAMLQLGREDKVGEAAVIESPQPSATQSVTPVIEEAGNRGGETDLQQEVEAVQKDLLELEDLEEDLRVPEVEIE